MTTREVEDLAISFRVAIRKKASLPCDWDKASESMKDWYRARARLALSGRILENS